MPNNRNSVSFSLSPRKRHSILENLVDVVSPATCRQSLSTPAQVNALLTEVDDEAEKKERQLTRLQQLNSRTFSPNNASTDWRKSLGNTIAGLSNEQLAQHYAQCIQLYAENKINDKNAFNLQLIDYMSEMVKRKDSNMHNFQVAGCTLDASAKIYAHRVDNLHKVTMKVVDGLSRTQSKKGSVEDGRDTEEDLGEPNNRIKKKKRSSTIVQNTKSIDMVKADLEFEVDPLFKKRAAQFDEGGFSGGHFLLWLGVQDDGCRMALGTDLVVEESNVKPTHTELVSIPSIPDMSEKVICREFGSFSFGSWFVEDEDESSCLRQDSQSTDHAFDVAAIPEPLSEEPFDDNECCGMDDVADDDEGHIEENDAAVTLGGVACRQQGGPYPAPPTLECVHLKEHLANVPLEYSYFDTRVMSTWAGPKHWRLRPLSSDKISQRPPGSRGRKPVDFTLEYSQNPEADKCFRHSKRGIQLQHSTLRAWNMDRTTYPHDLHYNAAEFSKLYNRPGLVVRKQRTKPSLLDESIRNYDYDNPNDKENYCPNISEDRGDNSSNAGDLSRGDCEMSDIFSQTVLPNVLGFPATGQEQGDFLGDNLVAAPNLVAKIDIGYVRVAKRINIKKLKQTVWDMLLHCDSNKENRNNNMGRSEAAKEAGSMEQGCVVPFSRLFRELPGKLPSRMVEDLTVHQAFITILHLANEHQLSLSSSGELGDFTIQQE